MLSVSSARNSAMNSATMNTATMPAPSSVTGASGISSATISGPAGTVTPFLGAAAQGKDIKGFAAAGIAVMVAALLL